MECDDSNDSPIKLIIMNFTTIEQSQALIEAGLNPETADMWYNYECWTGDEVNGSHMEYGDYSDYPTCVEEEESILPCWSTWALIDLLPFEICIGSNKNLTYQLRFGKGKNEFWITYESQIADLKGVYIGFNTAIDKCDMADCVYKMVMFCLEKGFIKKAEPCE